jgi:hypothetical protein
MALSRQAKAIYQQYLKATERWSRLNERERAIVFDLLNGDAVMDPATGEVRERSDSCAPPSRS